MPLKELMPHGRSPFLHLLLAFVLQAVVPPIRPGMPPETSFS